MKSFRLSFVMLRDSFSKKRVLAGYLLGISTTLIVYRQFNQFTGTHPIFAGEPFIWTYMSMTTMIQMFFGFLIIIMDAPFVRDNIYNLLYRSGRTKWYVTMWIYIIEHAFLYYGSNMLLSMLLILRKSYLHNVWSIPVTYLVEKQQYTNAEIYKIAIPSSSFIQSVSPREAVFWTFILIILFSLLMAGVLYVFNLHSIHVLGTVTCGVAFIVEVMVKALGTFLPVNLVHMNPLNNAVLAWRYDMEYPTSIWFSLFYLLILCILVFGYGDKAVCRYDFNYYTGNDHEG